MSNVSMRSAPGSTAAQPDAPFSLDGASLRIADLVAVARHWRTGLSIDERARTAMMASVRARNAMLERGEPMYGITTGFGDSVGRQISAAKTARLQHNLVTYHLNGVGPDAGSDVVRATMLIRANCLARGSSAIRPQVIDLLLGMLDAGVEPVIPERGSLGASGDLVPLCYVASALLGDGQVRYRDEVWPAERTLASAGLKPVTLEAKEGLALINGTSFTAAFTALGWWDAMEIAAVTDVATALSVEVLHGNASHFAPFVHEHKPHPGQLASAAMVRQLLAGSEMTTDYETIVAGAEQMAGRDFVVQNAKIQDPYSLRCAPHVNGVLRDSLAWARRWIEIEINSSTDNPLVDAEREQLHHGGNFYAGHVGMASDALKVAVASVCDLADRQLQLVIDEKFNRGLTPNLIAPAGDDEAGLHHGFKGMQIAASALTAEALQRTNPATAFSRSSEAHNQDKVSMGTIAARGLRDINELTRSVLAIHLLALCQALDLRGVRRASPASQRVHALIREHAPFVARDRRMDGDIAAVCDLIASGELRKAAGVAPSTDDER
jgi:phenylalanine ammonia-lyase